MSPGIFSFFQNFGFWDCQEGGWGDGGGGEGEWGYKGKKQPKMKTNNCMSQELHVPYLRKSIAYDHDF